MTSADLTRQYLEHKQAVKDLSSSSEDTDSVSLFRASDWWDKDRTMRMSFWGATVHPLAVHYWFNNLERWIGPNPLNASKLTVLRLALRKVIVDQLMSSPVFLGSFLAYSALTQGKTIEDTIHSFKDDWFTIMKGGWSCWPLAHLINFSIVPIQWRALYVNFVQLGFGMFLSMMGNQGGAGVITPVDKLYQRISGSSKTFGSVEGAATVIGISWVFGGFSMAYNWRYVGWNGLGCGIVGATVVLMELSVVAGQSALLPPSCRDYAFLSSAAASSSPLPNKDEEE
eukprot:CAMPEP_0184481932 /NCGR_PEP_ID=MMETSP0113_2-20130426/3522_1 /TAXON_ID=91329 /ORGANISM="Norrisiella sphaerica, Strain BC52" /LENGTH=283 /DNA_ID=CAMNT_0026861387 /DNA_START=337 /DNA_END=1188 /DNA_ORIENTATION=-